MLFSIAQSFLPDIDPDLSKTKIICPFQFYPLHLPRQTEGLANSIKYPSLPASGI